MDSSGHTKRKRHQISEWPSLDILNELMSYEYYRQTDRQTERATTRGPIRPKKDTRYTRYPIGERSILIRWIKIQHSCMKIIQMYNWKSLFRMLMFSERTARYVTDWVGNWQHILETFHSAGRTFHFYHWIAIWMLLLRVIVVLVLQY